MLAERMEGQQRAGPFMLWRVQPEVVAGAETLRSRQALLVRAEAGLVATPATEETAGIGIQTNGLLFTLMAAVEEAAGVRVWAGAAEQASSDKAQMGEAANLGHQGAAGRGRLIIGTEAVGV